MNGILAWGKRGLSSVVPAGSGIAAVAFVLALFGPAAWGAVCNSNGTAPQNWSNAATWTCGIVPTAADSVTISNGHAVTVNAPARSAGSLVIAGGATATSLTLATNLTVTNAMGGTGNVTMNAPTAAIIKQIVVGASPNVLDVTGNVTVNGGTTTANAGNINRLTATSGRVNIGGNLAINGGTVQSNAQVTLSTGRIDVTGNVMLTGGAAGNRDALLSVTGVPAVAGNGVNITGDLTIVSTVAASSNVTLGAGSLVTVTGNVTNGDTLTVGGGTFTANGATFATTAVGNSATTSVAAGTLSIAGNATVNASTTVNSTSTMTVSTGRISVTGDLTVTGGNNAALRNALLSVTGAPAAAGNGINVDGTLSTVLTTGGVTSATASITVANGVINANGNFTNSGTFTNNAVAGRLFLGGATSTINGSFIRGTGTVTMDGAPPLAVTQTLSGTALSELPAANGLNNFTINNTTGFGVTLGSTVAAKGTLTLTSGNVTTGANTLITVPSCATPSVVRASGHVNGFLRKAIPATLGTSCTFEVGGTSNYAPVTIAYPGTPTAGNITVSTTDGDHASIASSTLDPSLTANRYWTVNSPVALGTYNITLTFVAGDLDTDTQPLTLFTVQRFNQTSSTWGALTTGTRTGVSTQATGVVGAAATIYDFAVGEAERGSGTGSFNAVENIAVSGAVAGDAITGKIFTKLAGTAFTIDLVALNAARNAIDTTFKGEVKVELLNASDNTGVLDANSCRPTWTVIQTLGTNPQFLQADSGRKLNVSFTESNAWPNARVRVSSPATGTATLIGCSSDNFAIRPLGFTSVSSNMTQTGTSGIPKAIAGSDTFTLAAATGLTGYNPTLASPTLATPKIDNTAVQAHASAIQNGAVSGTFPAAVSGTSTGTSAFTYSEVGNFSFLGYDPASDTTSARGVYDDTFTQVDSSAADCTTDFSNTLVSGKYGCKFGITAPSSYFGRFYPKDFLLTLATLTNRQAASCAPVSNFTYAGEQFRVTFTLTARNGAGTPAITKNYDPVAGFASFDATTIANLSLGAVDLADATPPLTATALPASLTPGTSSGAWASGSVTVTADLMLTRAASPDGPFESFNLGIDPVDADAVKLSSYDLDTTVPPDTSDHGLIGTSKIRFGRLKMQNAHGSELLNLPIPVQVQYWNGSTFITNAADNCTTLATSNIKLTTTLTGVSTSGVAFSSGVGSLTLTKPTPAAKGVVDVCVDLDSGVGGDTTCQATTPAAKLYLQTGAAYNKDPTARATFGVYKGSNQFIYMRENY